MIDRFRSLPMARPAVLLGRSLTDLIRNVITLVIMAGLGLAVGFRFHSDAGRLAWMSFAWSAGITVVFFVTSYLLYQRATAR